MYNYSQFPQLEAAYRYISYTSVWVNWAEGWLAGHPARAGEIQNEAKLLQVRYKPVGPHQSAVIAALL